jgi:hypothetical protein
MSTKKRKAAARPVKEKVITIKGGLKHLHHEVIDDLFYRGFKESQVNAKYGLTPGTLRKWLLDDSFKQELRSRMHVAWSEARVKLARFAPEAAGKLIELTECEKEETARKACLDVIAMLPRDCGDQDEGDSESLSLPPQLSEETALRIFDILAEEKGQPVTESDSPAVSEPERAKDPVR